jgi:hypothetical protein
MAELCFRPFCLSGLSVELTAMAPARPPEAPWQSRNDCCFFHSWHDCDCSDVASWVVRFNSWCRCLFAQRFAREREAVMALHDAVEHGIGRRLITEDFMMPLS